MIRLLVLLILLPSVCWGACDCGSVNPLAPCTGTSLVVTVTDTGANGIDIPSVFTWNFNSNGSAVTCGEFANGDFWIAPASGETTVTVTSVTGSDSVTVDADPLPGDYGLLDGSNAYAGYDATETISFPQTYSTVTSLVAAIERDEADALVADCGTSAIVGECVDSYNVVTVLTSVPANCGSDMIRPNITGTTKEFYVLSDFDLARIPTETFLTGTNAAGFESMRQRWSHSIEIFALGFSTDGGTTILSNSEAGRALRSHILIDDYASGSSKTFHDDLATLFSDDNTIGEKTPAVAAMLSYGLDLYHARYDAPVAYYMKWGSGAGQHSGKFSPVALFASLLIANTDQLANVKSAANLSQTLQPQELAQLHVGANGPVWGDDEGILRYWNDLVWAQCFDGATGTCDITVGKRTAADPHRLIDGPANKPGTSYFETGHASIVNISAIMLLMPEFYTAVNTTKPIDFTIRVRNSGLLTLPDPCVNRDTREKSTTICNVWTGGLECDYYYPHAAITPTWGPKSLSDYGAGCGDVEISTYTVAGRFASLHGTASPPQSSYVASQLYDNWSTIQSLYYGVIRTVNLNGTGSSTLNGAGSLIIQ